MVETLEEEDEKRRNLLVEREVVVVVVVVKRGNGGLRSLGFRGKGNSEVEIAIVAELSSEIERQPTNS